MTKSGLNSEAIGITTLLNASRYSASPIPLDDQPMLTLLWRVRWLLLHCAIQNLLALGIRPSNALKVTVGARRKKVAVFVSVYGDIENVGIIPECSLCAVAWGLGQE